MNFKKIFSTIALLSALSCLALFLIVAIALWEENFLKRASNSFLTQLVSSYLNEDYKIKHLDINWSFRKILRSGGLEINSTLMTPYGVVQAQGPVRFERKSLINLLLKRHNELDIQLEPKLSFGNRQEDLSAFANGNLLITLKQESYELKKVDYKIDFDHLPLLPIEVEDLRLSGTLQFEMENIQLESQLSAKSWLYKNDSYEVLAKDIKTNLSYQSCLLNYNLSSNSLKISTTEIQSQSRLALKSESIDICDQETARTQIQLDLFDNTLTYSQKNLTLALSQIQTQIDFHRLVPKRVHATLTGQQLEILWKEEYLDPPLEKYKLSFDLFNEPIKNQYIHLKRLDLNIVKQKESISTATAKKILHLDIKGDDLLKPKLNKNIFFTSELSLADIQSFLPPVTLAGWDIHGNILGQGQIDYSMQKIDFHKGTFLKLDNFRLQHNELRHLSRDISVKWTASSNREMALDVSMPSIRQLNVKARVDPWHIPISLRNKRFIIPEVEIPLVIENLDLKLSPLKVNLMWQDQLEYSFESGLELAPIPLKNLSQQLCISPDLTPSGTLELHYSKLRLAHNHVYSQGKGLLKVFDGKIEINEFEIDKLLSEAPLTFFSAGWKNLDLARIGEFTHFGGMEGHASGYLNNVSFSGTILKDYDFEFRLKPLPKQNKFYFSREATQNLVEIFAQGQGLSQGPANFLLKLSSRLFGDYGISYAGLRAHTQQNFVVLETFDPPSVVKSYNSRFLLFGSRIKMPLSTQTYPVILSKNGWNGFVYYFRDSLLSLMNKPESESEDSDATGDKVEEMAKDLEPQEQDKTNQSATRTQNPIPCFDPNQEHRNLD